MIKEAISWVSKAFSENGTPSSARIISGWLSLTSMSLIWWVIHHMMWQPLDKLQVWIGGLPAIILALASFSVAPYGVGKFAAIFKKKDGGDDDSGSH